MNRNRTNHTHTHIHIHTHIHTHIQPPLHPYIHVCRDRHHAGPYSSTLLLRSGVPDGQWRDQRLVISTSSMAPAGLKLDQYLDCCMLLGAPFINKEKANYQNHLMLLSSVKIFPHTSATRFRQKALVQRCANCEKLSAVGGSFGIFGRTQLSASLATSWVQSL